MSRCVVISGCSGGGKSTLLTELARRGYETVEEPGRRVVRNQVASGGPALPWSDPVAFLQQAHALAGVDLDGCAEGLTFFDRGLLDAAIGLEHLTGVTAVSLLADFAGYDPMVFLMPPWPEIYVTDTERRHGFDTAVAEYERLLVGLPRLGYEVIIVPKVSVSARADFVLAALGGPTRQ